MGREDSDEERRRRLPGGWVLPVMVITGLLVVGVWTQRAPLAENFVNRELGKMGVRARYDLVDVGLRTQRIENVVLGDPARPDLTAKWVEIDLGFAGFSPSVAALRAGGVRLRGALRGSQLSLGELDKFRDPASTAPFSLPDIDVTLNDARVSLATDYGPVGLAIEGSGGLQDGFAGRLGAAMPHARFADCRMTNGTALLAVTIRAGEPGFQGPVKGAALDCPGERITVAQPRADLDMRLSAALDQWKGGVELSAEAARVPQGLAAAPRLGLKGGGKFDAMKGSFVLLSKALAGAGAKAGSVRANGRWRFAQAGKRLSLGVDGLLTARDVRHESFRSAGGLRTGAQGTPVGPLLAKLADALDAAGKGNSVAARFAFAQEGDAGRLAVTAADLSSRSGARVALGDGSRMSVQWPGMQGRATEWALDGSATMDGGGLPKAALRLTRKADGGASGQLFMDDYAAGNARLAIERLNFTVASGGGTRFVTEARLDGPLGDGEVKGLILPIEGRIGHDGAVAVATACTPVSLTSLQSGGVTLGRTRLTVCPERGALLTYDRSGLGGGGVVRAPRIEGRMGSSPMRLVAQALRFGVARPGFSAIEPELRIGAPEAPVLLRAASLDGAMERGGLAGRVAGGSGQIGAVPLLGSDLAGAWSFRNGVLDLKGGLLVSDAAVPARFNPMRSDDFSLRMANSRIDATGTMSEPRTKRAVLTAKVDHDLGKGAGQADIAVAGINFDGQLQPDDLTRLALGVVANVRGKVEGEGHVRWNARGVASDGVFRTAGTDLAAAFGPVAGLSGEIRFTDLLGLVSAPGQEAHIASVNPGIEATDGVVRYQLQAGQKVHVEGGEWPFSGGQLVLLPTTMDFSADSERYLTFRVIGLDAGSFINKLELENISATGTFDGIMPLIFNAQGGRIQGGVLVARQQGLPALIMPEGVLPTIPCDPARQSGTLSYVGPVTNEQVGAMGKIAFDALKDLQYKCLSILMDGWLDGEVVTNVVFNGVNRAPVGNAPGGFAGSFVGLPFLFNVRVQAPFRGLLSTAKSFVDPSTLVSEKLGDDYQQQLSNQKVSVGVAVKPGESETVPNGKAQ